jgi:plasmid stability protein
MDARQTQLQELYLNRLKRMSWLAQQEAGDLEIEAAQSGLSDEVRRRLIFRAMFSTYLACKQQGVEAEARSILGNSPMAESFRQAFD